MTSPTIVYKDPLSSVLEPSSDRQVRHAIAVLDEWMADESGYDEENWDDLKDALDKERELVGANRIFGLRC